MFNIIQTAVNLLLLLASVLFFFSFLIGGLKIIISAGNKEKMNNAKRQLIGAFVGIIIVFSSWAIIKYIGDFY